MLRFLFFNVKHFNVPTSSTSHGFGHRVALQGYSNIGFWVGRGAPKVGNLSFADERSYRGLRRALSGKLSLLCAGVL